MDQGSSNTTAAHQHPVGLRHGICRICFEGGGELIAPCRCRGSSRWIHRQCLNTWRASQRNTQVMTHCSECRFQYHLVLSRSAEGNPQLRALMRRLASQTILGFIGVQFIIIALGMLIRAVDTQEKLVKAFNFPSERNHQDASGYVRCLRNHPETYYVAGVLAALILFSLPVCVLMIRDVITIISNRRWGQSMRFQCIMCEGCIVAVWISPKTPAISVVGITILALGGLATLGLLCVLVALVLTVQYVVREYARLQQAHLVAEEYVVSDLADPDDLGEAPPESNSSRPDLSEAMAVAASVADAAASSDPTCHASEEQSQIQRMIADEMQDIFGAAAVAEQTAFVGPARRTSMAGQVGQGTGSYGSTQSAEAA